MKTTRLLNPIILLVSAATLLAACGTSSSSSTPVSSDVTPVSSDVTPSSSAEEKENVYSLSVHYDDNNKDQIPSDAVNQVMFAYSETVDVDFKTDLTLDPANKTYELYKQIVTPERELDDGTRGRTFHGQYKFLGSYEGEGNDITLKAPTSGEANIYYPTVLNYQSIEKQTQGWVSFEDEPVYRTRFNDWYPAKLSEATDQKVTLKGNTMEFEGHTIDNGEEPEPSEEKTVVISGTGSTLGSTLAFNSDKTYTWSYSVGGRDLTEEGSWTLNESNLIVLTYNDNSNTSVLDAETNNQTIEFTPYSLGGYAAQMKDTFVFSVGQWGQLTLVKVKEEIIHGTGTNNGVLTFFNDKSYSWALSVGGRELAEEGVWSFDEGNCIVLTNGENVNKGVIGEDNAQTIEYTPYSLGGYAAQMKETFTFAVGQWGQLTLVA